MPNACVKGALAMASKVAANDKGCFGKSPRNSPRARPKKMEEEEEEEEEEKTILYQTPRSTDHLPRVSRPIICANKFHKRNRL